LRHFSHATNFAPVATFQERANFIWSIADLLRGDFKQSEYGRVILPLTILRRLDCLLEPKKPEILQAYQTIKNEKTEVVDKILNAKSGFKFFHNHSNFINLNDLLGEPDKIAENLTYYLNSFSESVKEIFDNFRFAEQIQRLDKANLVSKSPKNLPGLTCTAWATSKWATSSSISFSSLQKAATKRRANTSRPER